MILTSNCGFAEWAEVFGDLVVATALLDRLLHHAVVIQIKVASSSPVILRDLSVWSRSDLRGRPLSDETSTLF